MVQIWSLEGRHLTALTHSLSECSWNAVIAYQRSAQSGPSKATYNKGEKQEEHVW